MVSFLMSSVFCYHTNNRPLNQDRDYLKFVLKYFNEIKEDVKIEMPKIYLIPHMQREIEKNYAQKFIKNL